MVKRNLPSTIASRLGTAVRQGVAAQGGVLGAAAAANRNQYAVLTTHRMIFLTQGLLGGPGKKVLGEVPRQLVSLAEAQIGFMSLLRISFGTAGDGISLTFPRADKKNAEQLAAALQGATV